MVKFQIVSPHLPTECLQATGHWLTHEPAFLRKAWNGCDLGDHTMSAVVDAATAEEAGERIPKFLRRKARMVQVRHTTPAQIRAQRDGLARARIGEAR